MVGCTRPGRYGHPSLSGVGPSVTVGSWLSDIRNPSGLCGTAGSRAVAAQAPVKDLGLVNREAVVIGWGQAGCLADRAVDVSDDTARPAHDMMMVIADTPLEPDRAARRFDAADETRLGQRVQGLVDGLQGNMANPVTHP